MKTLVYICGSAGSGKSTLMRHLTARCTRTARPEPPLAHELLHRHGPEPVAAELGLTTGLTSGRNGLRPQRRRGLNPGTDTLTIRIVPKAPFLIRDLAPPLVLGEGFRLSACAFVLAADTLHDFHLVHLYAPPGVDEQRCARRGTATSAAFIRGTRTKAERLAAHAEAEGVRVIHLDGTLAPQENVRLLTERISALEVLA